jgi:hypothetical protein
MGRELMKLTSGSFRNESCSLYCARRGMTQRPRGAVAEEIASFLAAFRIFRSERQMSVELEVDCYGKFFSVLIHPDGFRFIHCTAVHR